MPEPRASIVATIGPASSSPEVIERMVRAGMDVARINFSHGSNEEHRRCVERVRKVSGDLGKPVACLQDLCGPKIRTGSLIDSNGVELVAGATFVLTTERIEGTENRVSTTYSRLHEEVFPGERILLDDGLIELGIESVSGRDIHTRVVSGGLLKPAKGINFPGTELSVAALTDKDRNDVAFGLELGVDYIALSFVRRPQDIGELKSLLASLERPDIPVIAKIEKPEAIKNLDAILDAAEGVMVARGDLGVEMPASEVPMYQKKIIHEARRRGRLVITATQMLDSMIRNPRPTRAEASDVANAVLDGTDAVMLSGETAVGRHPVETVATMAQITRFTESMQNRIPWKWPEDDSLLELSSISRAIAKSACTVAEELDAHRVIVFTESGETARLISNYRPTREVIALTPSKEVCRQLALPWGITPLRSRHYDSVEQLLREGLELVRTRHLVDSGDIAVVVFGESLLPGASNVMKVHRFP